MTKYERYTSKDGATLTMSQWGGSPAELELYRKLAELEDKIENGTLVELPCKVGTDIFVIVEVNAYYENGHVVIEYDIEKRTFVLSDLEYWEEMCFLTRKEAKAKLRELKGEQL